MKKLNVMISTRPVYPTNKLTFFPKDFNKDKVDWIDVYLKADLKFDVEIIFEDAQRWGGGVISRLIIIIKIFSFTRRLVYKNKENQVGAKMMLSASEDKNIMKQFFVKFQ